MKGLEAKTLGLRKMLRHEYKRIVAFMLTVAMVVTNFGTNLTVAFAAGEEESSLFLLNSSELEDAISAALESGDVFDFSSLELKAKQKSLKTSYEKLIGSKAGKVYQLDVDVDSTYATENTDLQVFYNAGTDSVVFLFINQSDMAVTFRANVSGYETARVTVNPNTSNIEDAEGVENAEDYSGTTMVDDEKKPQAEVVKPEGETSESEENGSDETDAAETETGADVTESETASENGEAEETTGAEETAETETTAAEETEAETEPETEAEAPAADEAEEEIELTPEEGSASASISAKKVFRVSTSAEAAVEAPAADAEEETEAETETEAEEPEKETEAPVETTAEETVADDSTEETIADETQTDETTAADETDGELTDETEAPTEDVTAPDETNGEEPADNDGSENIGFDNDEQFLEDDSIELAGELNGKAYNTVTIWGSANARAYVVKAEDLTGEAAVEGQYSVDYSVDPVGAATIKGAHTVNEGETLYFAVDPQVGYEITEVTANGEELEEVDAAGVASASNLEKYAHVYAVEEVSEDLEIVASLEETAPHPGFEESVTVNGVTITATAEEGILPEGTTLSVEEVTEQVQAAVKEKVEGENEGTTVTDVIAYDINLMLDGKKLNNEAWNQDDNYVTISFAGKRIEEASKKAEQVQVASLETPTETVEAALGGTAEMPVVENITANDIGVQTENFDAVDVSGEKSVKSVKVEAEHFTVYTVYFYSNYSYASRKFTQVNENGKAFGKDRLNVSFENITPDAQEGNKRIYNAETIADTLKNPEGYVYNYITDEWGYKVSQFAISDWGFSYYRENSGNALWNDSSFKVYYRNSNMQVTFDSNGGSKSAPASITVKAGERITLPEYTGKKGDKVFVGWSEIKNANADGNYKPGKNGTVYPAGSEYAVSTKDVTLYATWSDKNVDAYFYIRLDGQIPTEPQGHEASEYIHQLFKKQVLLR